ncbi:MAG: hypothetical protein IKG18_08195 [Atopobiaceae bacterium]|nr:hypothetical protein [Atopobiaceae bacterium]
MQVQQLTKGVHYGIAFENTSSVDALMRLVHMLTPFEIDSLLVLPYRVNDDFTKLASRLDALSLEGFQGVVVVSVLGISCTDDALFACLNLRDALNSPELTLISVASSERKAELAKALAISGFSDFPTR